MTTDRIKDINKFIDNILTQDEWEYNYNKKINKLILKYSNQLDNYNCILKEEIDDLKIGGYIKYIDTNDNLIWGGLLVKIDATFIYMKKDYNIIKINKYKNVIFYRNHRTQNDKYREIFTTSMEKYS